MMLLLAPEWGHRTHDTIMLPRNGFFIPASWKKSAVSRAGGSALKATHMTCSHLPSAVNDAPNSLHGTYRVARKLGEEGNRGGD